MVITDLTKKKLKIQYKQIDTIIVTLNSNIIIIYSKVLYNWPIGNIISNNHFKSCQNVSLEVYVANCFTEQNEVTYAFH